MVAARVIGTSADTASQTIYLDRGERDGIRRNMGVITPDGVVGKVIESYRDTSQVLLAYRQGQRRRRDAGRNRAYRVQLEAWANRCFR